MHRVGFGSSGRSRRTKTGANFKMRAVQGDVTINLQVNDKEPLRRQEFQKAFPDNARMGHYTGVDQIDIQRGDPVFVINQDSPLVRNKLPMEMKNLGIVGFNAMPLLGARTTEEYQRLYKFVGLSKNPYQHGSVSQPENGIAVQHRGATSTMHTGSEEFSPGDRISFVVPDPNPKERKRRMKEAGFFKGIERDQLRAVPRRVTYEESVRLPQHAMVVLFRNTRPKQRFDERMSLKRLRPRDRIQLSQREEFALSIKQDGLYKAWSTVAVLAHYGLITLNMPSISSTTGARSLNDSLLREKIWNILGRQNQAPTVQVRGTAAVANVTDADTPQRARLRSDQLQWLAVALDLAHDDVSPKTDQLQPAQNLIDAIIGTQSAFMFRNDRSQRALDARRFINKKLPLESLGKTVSDSQKTRFARDTIPAQLAKRQHDAVQGYYRSAITAKLAAEDQVHAIALNTARPKEAIDVLM